MFFEDVQAQKGFFRIFFDDWAMLFEIRASAFIWQLRCPDNIQGGPAERICEEAFSFPALAGRNVPAKESLMPIFGLTNSVPVIKLVLLSGQCRRKCDQNKWQARAAGQTSWTHYGWGQLHAKGRRSDVLTGLSALRRKVAMLANYSQELRLSLPAMVLALLLSGKVEGDFIYTTISVPGSSDTAAYGINNAGQIIGDYNLGRHGFILSNGVYTTLDIPGAVSISPVSINDSGQVAGYYTDSRAKVHGFLYSGGTYTQMDVPGSMNTYLSGINNAGNIVGLYSTPTGTQGFLLKNGNLLSIDFPGGTGTTPIGINNLDQIVGYYGPHPGGSMAGFLLSGGSYTTLTVPGSLLSKANGINDTGDVVGDYDSDLVRGFLLSGGSYTTLDPPGSRMTYAFGINNAHMIVGEYHSPRGGFGFLATPVPAPKTVALLTLGAILSSCLLASKCLD